LVEADVKARASIYVKGHHLNGTDALALQATMESVKAKLVIVTGSNRTEGGFPYLYPQIVSVYAPNFNLDLCTFGEVNGLLLQNAFNELMRPVGALFHVSNEQLAVSLFLKIPTDILGSINIEDMEVFYYD
jgi:hypothetical protein